MRLARESIPCRPMTESKRTSSYRFGTFELQPSERRLLASGELVALGPRAFDLLVALVERSGQLVTKEDLLDRVWPKLVVEENNLQVQVSALRKILGQQAIATVPGRGYRFTVTLTGGSDAGSPPASSPRNNLPQPFPPLKTLLAPIDANAPSIAVLPFVNMSDDAANEYFADGIAEELLNVLSKIRGLRVASHTSAFSFKGGNVDIPTVARKLNVATILEGSVRKFGKRVRITVQLVQVATDSHLWSETYDRELEDIFAVQDDIAQSVVKELRSALLGEKRDSAASAAVKVEVRVAATGRGENAEAYRLYLQGRSMVGRRTQASVTTGIAHLRQAVDLDPEYALAWAALAYAETIEAGSIGSTPYEEGYRRARKAAERALALEPDVAEGHIALGLVRLGYDWDWVGAEASWRRALELAPGNADVVLSAARIAASLGHLDESITLCQRAIALDPLNAHSHRNFGLSSFYAGFLEQAESAVKEALELNPLGGMTHWGLGQVYLAQGRFAEALAAFEKESHDGFRLLGLAMAYHALGRKAQSSAALEQLGELPMHAYLNAQANAYCGNVDVAFEWLERAYTQRNAGLADLNVAPLLRNLHCDPRWPLFRKKMGHAD